MIRVTTNISEVTARLKTKFESLQKGGVSYDKGLRAACASLVGDMKVRIHQDGLNYDGSKIGEYSNPYMRLRKANNRTDSKDIVISLTRNLENNFTVVVNDAGTYGVGWADEGTDIQLKKPSEKPVKKMKAKKSKKPRKSIGNSDKYFYVNENYPKVYVASDKEKERALAAFNEVVGNLFK